MKKIRTLLAAILVFVMVFSATGCKKERVPDDENTLEISVISRGLGTSFLDELKKVFEAENPGKTVYVVPTYVEDEGDVLQSGPKANTADLMFTMCGYYPAIESGANYVKGYDYALVDLTDFIDETVYEDGTKLRDRFLDNYIGAAEQTVMIDGEYQDRVFRLSWAASNMGIVYNKTLFDSKNWKLPNTTDELFALADTIKKDNIIPFVNDTSAGYMTYFGYTLFAQYLGAEDYVSYFMPASADDWYKYTSSFDSTEAYARYYALDGMNKLQNPTYGRLNPKAQQDDYGRSQARLISGEGAMGINGDWFDREMSTIIDQANENGEYATGFMRVPVVSALSDKLSYWDKTVNVSGAFPKYYDAQSGVETAQALAACDELLSKLVEYTDNGRVGELPSINYGGKTITATESDADCVDKARRTVCSLGASHCVSIPAYSNAIPLAKEFLKFMYSDRGAEICMKNMGGGMLPIKYDVTKSEEYATATAFEKATYQNSLTAIMAPYPAKVLDYKVSSLPTPTGRFYMYAEGSGSYVSPHRKFLDDSLTRSKFEEILYNAGII